MQTGMRWKDKAMITARQFAKTVGNGLIAIGKYALITVAVWLVLCLIGPIIWR